jgi:VanZ family protein
MAEDSVNTKNIKTKTSGKFWIPAIAWAAIILILSTIAVPDIKTPNLFFPVDKIVHFFFYGSLALLIIFPLRRSPAAFSPIKSLLTAFIVSSAYGIIMEIYQSFVGRYMEFGDAAANIIGAALAGIMYLLVCLFMAKATGENREQREHPSED